MRNSALYFLFLIFSSAIIYPQPADTLIINLKDGTADKIALTRINNIVFDIENNVSENMGNGKPLKIFENFPNPFSDRTSIEIEISSPGNVVATIYDIFGREIRELTLLAPQSGKNSLPWDGLDKNNNKAPNGTYIYTVRFQNETASGKLILHK